MASGDTVFQAGKVYLTVENVTSGDALVTFELRNTANALIGSAELGINQNNIPVTVDGKSPFVFNKQYELLVKEV